MQTKLVEEKDYVENLRRAVKEPGVLLAYGRLDPNLSGQALLHIVRDAGEPKTKDELGGVGFESGG
ncbi:MAG: hypothetical protein AAB263_18275, partial [Planctomycetota bacterium]